MKLTMSLDPNFTRITLSFKNVIKLSKVLKTDPNFLVFLHYCQNNNKISHTLKQQTTTMHCSFYELTFTALNLNEVLIEKNVQYVGGCQRDLVSFVKICKMNFYTITYSLLFEKCLF